MFRLHFECARLYRAEETEKIEKQAAEDGCDRIQDAMKHIPERPSEYTKEDMLQKLHKAQLLLDSCVEAVLINQLGSFKSPVAERLGELWKFPSDHPPVGADLKLAKHSIKAVSWNVLNKNYYEYIVADTQGLKGSEITTYHEAGTREGKIVEKIQEMLQKNFQILCLQECWPELLEQLKGALREHRGFEMHCSGEEQDKNQEASAPNRRSNPKFIRLNISLGSV